MQQRDEDLNGNADDFEGCSSDKTVKHLNAFRWNGNLCLAALALVGILLLALSLRGVQLHAGRLDVDEAFTWLLASRSVADIAARTGADTHPPLHYLLLHEWRAVFGASAVSLRFVSALFGVLVLGKFSSAARLIMRIVRVSAPFAGLRIFCKKTSSRSTQGVDTSIKPATFTGSYLH